MILLHMSISGGVLILLTVAVRFLAAEKLPKRTFVMLWGITALRLLIPFDLSLHYGISSPITRAADRALRSVSAVSEPVTGVFIAVEEGDASYTGQLKTEEGAPEVVVEVNDEMTDNYHVETDQTENGEITVSISSQTK